MPQITGPISINNGAATPVAKSFAPMRVAPEQSIFAEKSAGVSAGYTLLKLGFSSASSQRPTTRVDFALDFPILNTINGVSTVASVARFRGYWVIPDTLTDAQRADFEAFVKNGIASAPVNAAVKNLDPSY